MRYDNNNFDNNTVYLFDGYPDDPDGYDSNWHASHWHSDRCYNDVGNNVGVGGAREHYSR